VRNPKAFAVPARLMARSLSPLLSAAKAEELTVVWIPVSYSMYRETPLFEYQAASDPSSPLKSLSEAEQDRLFRRYLPRNKRFDLVAANSAR
jgi:hypothetical protein